MGVTAEQVKQLRDRTGAGMMECKKALTETSGDVERALEALRKSGIAKAEKRSGREASEGLVEAYIHPGSRVGVLVEVNCETDFVARTDEFKALVMDIAMQVAAAGAEYVRREDVPEERVAKERDILTAQIGDTKKPPEIIAKIVEGRLSKFYSEIVLYDQVFIKDDKKKVGDLIQETAGRTGENIVVRRFSRFTLGQE